MEDEKAGGAGNELTFQSEVFVDPDDRRAAFSLLALATWVELAF